MTEEAPGGPGERAALSPPEAAEEARALAIRAEVTAYDVVGVLREVREARERV
ncbi:hypothetical protein PEM37_28150 [Streptomyces sp. AD681]|uniref:hypothetical protein n=1 Tax=Streptomyces sp. AD681 TaxID=3019069 RepID=UPI0022F19980|nr:hypothetical protein [Streptomyces sp. AD681]MDA5145386.1 hypothetical protein [Streptomyces sp. AD681]